MAVLFDDTFNGIGVLSAHVSDSGLGWTVISPLDGVVGTGLRPEGYPGGVGSLEARSANFVTTTGKFVAVAIVDIHYSLGGYAGYFEFGVRDGTGDGVSCGVSIYSDGPYIELPVVGPIPVPMLVQGENYIRFEVEVGTRNGQIWVNDSLLHTGQIIYGFADVMPANGGAWVGMAESLDARLVRLYIADDGAGPAPVTGSFWTNIIKAVEQP